jgi:hypothetical protein
MDSDSKIVCLEVENAYTHNWVAYFLFDNICVPQHHLVAEVAFRAVVPPVLVEVRKFLCTSSGSAHSLLYHFGMGGSWPYDFCKPLLGVFLSQPSPSDAQETQLLASSLLGLQRKDSSLVVAFPFLCLGKTHLWPFSPYSRQGACQTVAAVPDLLASP